MAKLNRFCELARFVQSICADYRNQCQSNVITPISMIFYHRLQMLSTFYKFY